MIWALLLLFCCSLHNSDQSHLDFSERFSGFHGKGSLERQEVVPQQGKSSAEWLDFETYSEDLRSLDYASLHTDKGSCSTWGTGHFSTFDNYLYDFSGTCNYVFATVCDDISPDFNIQFRRGADKNITRIIINLGPNAITVENGVISTNTGGIIKIPYARNGIQITPFGKITRLVAKLMEMELAVFWNNEDYLMALIEQKYMTRTCGLCGNFDGQELNEFLNEGSLLDPYKYAALQKIDDPAEVCPYEEMAVSNVPRKKYTRICSQLLNLVSPSCNISRKEFVIRCQLDIQDCRNPGQKNCVCATLSEYSRQCAMSHQEVSNWRKSDFCSLGSCPTNQIYQECGSPCLKTCSNPEYICSSYCTYGCFCPEGTVLDDISRNQTCVPIEQCPCMLNGETYAPGETMKATCRTCKCTMGQWSCTELPCPGRCSLEGGSFVTTFDSRPYRFHGVCTYILMKSPMLPHNGTLMGVYEKSGYSHTETSLSAIIYVSGKDRIVISKNEVLMDDNEIKWFPYKTGNFVIFRQSSTHLQMYTNFGLELVVQIYPVFQVYIKAGLQFKGNTQGLCGNYNGETTDDFMTSMDIIEGTATLFVDSWRLENCPPSIERDTDPCSMSQLNKMCAETHCSVLIKKDTIFEKCHAAVNPVPFYKRCVYQACNYEETFPYICSALASYARVCASMGVILGNWRSTVDNCTIPCTGNQTFSYNAQACDRTCLSLSHRDLECYPSDIPIDGCNCPEGTYLNHKNQCVRKSQCPCYLKGRKFIHADQSTIIGGFTCYCINGNLSCTGKPVDPAENCKPPKKYISCSAPSGNKYGAACAPTCQMLATGTECVPSKCESGCVCEAGLYEKMDGTCVPPDECPCEYGGISYAKGEEIRTDCKTCTCTRGKWKCIQNYKCSSTCTLHGEGHITTFDGQRFVFDGNCEYILAMDSCGLNGTPHTFKIVTENVVCGNTGVTCSRSIKIHLGNMTIHLADRTYGVSGMNPLIDFSIKENTLHLTIDISIPGKYDMTLIWNRHMNIFIKLFKEAKDNLCGLCGNYNGNIRDDFETRSRYVASNELEFVNSWKENPLCGDVLFATDPCSQNPYRKAWAQKKCSIINSQVFASCHSKVHRTPYYEDCVRDSCGCDTGGDCECMCDAVAVYAKACLEAGVCIDWRAPDFCPVYCDYFNTHKKNSMDGTYYHYVNELNCTWHYRPCNCPFQLQNYPYVNNEGCYNCSQDEYFDHKVKACVPCNIPTTPHPTMTPVSTTSTPTAVPVSTSEPPTTVPVSTTSTPKTVHPSPTKVPQHKVSTTERKTTVSPKTTITTKKITITTKPGTTKTTLEKSTITQTTRTTKRTEPPTLSTASTTKRSTSTTRKSTMRTPTITSPKTTRMSKIPTSSTQIPTSTVRPKELTTSRPNPTTSTHSKSPSTPTPTTSTSKPTTSPTSKTSPKTTVTRPPPLTTVPVSTATTSPETTPTPTTIRTTPSTTETATTRPATTPVPVTTAPPKTRSTLPPPRSPVSTPPPSTPSSSPETTATSSPSPNTRTTVSTATASTPKTTPTVPVHSTSHKTVPPKSLTTSRPTPTTSTHSTSPSTPTPTTSTSKPTTSRTSKTSPKTTVTSPPPVTTVPVSTATTSPETTPTPTTITTTTSTTETATTRPATTPVPVTTAPPKTRSTLPPPRSPVSTVPPISSVTTSSSSTLRTSLSTPSTITSTSETTLTTPISSKSTRREHSPSTVTSTPTTPTSVVFTTPNVSVSSSSPFPPTISTTITSIPLTTRTTTPIISTKILTTSELPTTSLPTTSELPTSSEPPAKCRAVEYEGQVRYKGCVANVTLTRCEGMCPSYATPNIDKMTVDVACTCCMPRTHYKKEVTMPGCPDPDNPQQLLSTEIIVFGHCECQSDACDSINSIRK